MQSLIDEIKVLNPDDGSIVVVKTSATDRTTISQLMSDVGQPLVEYLKDRKCTVLVFPVGVDISVLSEKAMNDLGWFKKPKIVIA